eukprot:g19437.t1
MQTLGKVLSCFCEGSPARSPNNGFALPRRLKVVHLAHLPPEDFVECKEGAAASHAWLLSAIEEQRHVPISLWVLYREWVDDVEQVDSWHHFVVARALGLNLCKTKETKPHEAARPVWFPMLALTCDCKAADLVALLAEDNKLGHGNPADSLEAWLDETREAFDFRFRKAHHRSFDGLTIAEEHCKIIAKATCRADASGKATCVLFNLLILSLA